MIRFDRAPWVVQTLQEAGVYVRDRSGQQRLENYVRFTIGTVEHTYDLLDRLGAVLDRLGATPG
jgi:histidinol-phosphate/aromatic aminotransferase/cobyric acid decarboxylase-like protein